MGAFTQQQRQAIELRGNVLVVAGAGTGKTRTLVQRCVEWLLEAPGDHSLDQILMVTFTDAAAAEMRRRIREVLRHRLDQDPNNSFLLEQLALLETAYISTLHSFCFRLVRQHFYELELDPQLAILPVEEAQLLADETLARILERHYAGTSREAAAVRRMIEVQARGWDAPVRRLVLRLHAFTQTLPDAKGWIDSQVASFSTPAPTLWQSWMQGALGPWVEMWRPVLEGIEPKTPNVARSIDALKSLPKAPTADELRFALDEIAQARETPWPRGTAGTVRDKIKDFFHEAEFLLSLTVRSSLAPDSDRGAASGGPTCAPDQVTTDDPLEQDWSWVRPHMLALLELTAEFGLEFADAKRELGVVDFHDLEQLSLRLLWKTRDDRPTALADHWRRQLRLILVDEYQDINAAQDAILLALGRDGAAANRFLVGDPKQSIYRFRLADPRIFQEYTKTWQADPANHGHVAPLTENFRSHEAILNFVNRLFTTLMRAEIGGVAYDETARLQFGNPEGRKALSAAADTSAPEARPRVELHLRLTGSQETESDGDEDSSQSTDAFWESLSNAEKEARLVGLRLAELRNQKHHIWDAQTGEHRPVEWSDMVVLLRSPRLKAESYAKEFARLGIPLVAARGGFFDSPEVMDLLSLLTLLDNPLQDIPLLTVLRSPVVALALDELALIRLASTGRYWAALQQFHQHMAADARGPQCAGPDPDSFSKTGEVRSRLDSALLDPKLRQVALDAWVKVDTFLRQFSQWRRLARQLSLSPCLDQILRETNYQAFLSAQAHARHSGDNVTKLLAWARQFDQFHRQGLFRFLKLVEAQRDAEMDREPALAAAGNAVRLMSIHQSKGLEFNVVVLADLGKLFNLSDLKKDIILDSQFGLCPLVKPPFTEQRYPSLPYWLAQRRQRQETLAEETRLLYVAMTRACDTLLLAGTTARSAAERWQKRAAGPFTTRELLAARSYLDWLGPWMTQAAGSADWISRPDGQCALLPWTVYTEDDTRLRDSTSALTSPGPAPAEVQILDRKTEEALLARLNWKYPFEAAVRQSAKSSVSTLRAGTTTELLDDEARRSAPGFASFTAKRGELSAAAVGIAHHTFLQHLALEQATRPAHLASEAQRLVQAGLLTPSEAASLNLETIAKFWQSKVGETILGERESLHRELPFTLRLSLREVLAFQADHACPVSPVLSSTGREGVRETGEGDPLALIARSSTSGNSPSNPSKPNKTTAFQDEEFVIVTGVVDLMVLLPKEIWLLDFKTDAVTSRDLKEKAALYGPQMQLYALALSRIYARPVTHAWLHFLTLGQTIE